MATIIFGAIVFDAVYLYRNPPLDSWVWVANIGGVIIGTEMLSAIVILRILDNASYSDIWYIAFLPMALSLVGILIPLITQYWKQRMYNERNHQIKDSIEKRRMNVKA